MEDIWRLFHRKNEKRAGNGDKTGKSGLFIVKSPFAPTNIFLNHDGGVAGEHYILLMAAFGDQRTGADDGIGGNTDAFEDGNVRRDPNVVANGDVFCVIDAFVGGKIDDGMGIAGSYFDIVGKSALFADGKFGIGLGNGDIYISVVAFLA